MARSTESAQRGGAALDEVAANFARIGWGPARNPEPFDLGTDLWIQARDRNLVDRGVLVGAQVKGGPSYFDKELRDASGELLGWYYAASADRFDYWSSHAVPHLLVLHNLSERVSYWVHVTPQSVESTGKQCKILVPIDQTISDACFDQLMEVAASQRTVRMLGGTAWEASASAIPPNRRWRHALLVPRLVAPHRNRGLQVELQPEEAAALAVRGLIRDWEHIAEKVDSVPTPEQSTAHADWGWRFAAAVDAAISGTLEPVTALQMTAPTSAECTAATVVLACQLATRDQHEAALALLAELSERPDLAPVDRAWALVQIARFRAEIGEIEEAVHDANRALQQLVGDENDVTAAALIASAGQLVWGLSEWTDRSLKDVITRGDTPAIWWRSQERGYAFAEYFEASFSNWSQEGGFSFSIVDEQVRGLISATVTADLAGDHGSWCSDAKALCRLLAMRAHTSGDAQSLTVMLDQLRRVGDDKGVQAVLRRIGETGPLEIVGLVTNSTTEAWWTRTSARSNLELWRAGSDLLDAETRERAIDFCIAALRDANHVLTRRTRPRFMLHSVVLPTLASLLQDADASLHLRVDTLARELLADNLESDLVRHELRGIAVALAWDALGNDAYAAWFDLIESAPNDELTGIVVSSLAANGWEPARDELVARAQKGEWQFVARLEDLSELGPDAARRIVELLQGRLDEMVSEAERGSWGMGMSIDFGALAVKLATAFPDANLWDSIVRLLACPVATAEQKAGACASIAVQINKVPDDVRQCLAENIDQVASATQDLFSADTGGMPFAVARLRRALGLLDDGAIIRETLGLLTSGSPNHRQLAAALLGLSQPAGLAFALPALLGDQAAEVRAEAAFTIAVLARADPSDPISVALVNALCNAPGRLLPLAALGGLARDSGPALSPDLLSTVEALGRHPSALVRRRAAELIG